MFNALEKSIPQRDNIDFALVFIVTFEYFTPFSSVAIVDFEQVNVSWEGTPY